MTNKGKKTKLIIIALAVICIAMCLFALCACSQAPTKDDILGNITGHGNTINVKLDNLNGVTKDYWLAVGSVIPQPGVTPNVSAPLRENYVFRGYYEGSVGENGEILYGDEWDFSTKVTENKVLYAKWENQYKIRIRYVVEGQVAENNSFEMNVYNNAETVTSIADPSWAGYTFVKLYTTAECTEEINESPETPFSHGCTDQNPVREIYAQFIEGNWKLVYDAADMATVYAGTNLYLMNDIDFASRNNATGATNISINSNTFVGSIEGNGHTISNLNFFRTGEPGTGRYYFGLFTRVQNVTIRNITFKDCSVSASSARRESVYYYGFLAGEASGTNVFENIVLDNCTVNALTFSFLASTASEEQIAAEAQKVVQGTFIAEGSIFEPTILP